MKQNEHDLQVNCIKIFKIKYPYKMIFSIPNAGKRSVRAGVYYKAEGLLAGVPDLFVPEPTAEYSGLFIEMKTKERSSKLTENQKNVIDNLQKRGYCVEVCRSIDEFMQVCNRYFSGA